MIVLVVALALLAALCMAISALLQHSQAVVAAERFDREGHHVGGLTGATRLMGVLLRSPIWRWGWIVNMVGFGVHTLALHFGSVDVVQPLLTTQILFALVLGTMSRHTRIPRRAYGFTVLIFLGLVLFLAIDRNIPTSPTPDRPRAVITVIVVVVLLLGLSMVSRFARRSIGSFCMACGAGICFGMTALFIKLTLVDLTRYGPVHTLTDWPLYAIVASTITSLVLEQSAFAQHNLPWAFAAMTAMNPISSFLAGVMVFHVDIPYDTAGVLGLVTVGVLLVVGIAGLSQLPMARGEVNEAEAVRRT